MKKLIGILMIALVATSCMKTYTYEKRIVNNSRHDVTVHSGCCGNEKDILIPANSEATVFVCSWQSFKKPNCENMEGKFNFNASDYQPSKDIDDSNNWFYSEDGKIISCTFYIDN